MERVDKDSNRAFYDSQRADDRRRFEEEPSKVHLAETLVQWVAAHVEPGARILDSAGGSGVYASKLVRSAAVSVVGLDISRSMIDQRRADPLLPENVVGDMEALPFRDESFDAVLFAMCLHHVPDPAKALAEAFRVLRPGGLLFAAEPCSLRVGRAGVAPVRGHQHEFRFTMGFLTARIRAAGFRIDRVTGRRLMLRFASRLTGPPAIGAFRAGDRIDRVLTALPGATRLAELALVLGSRPGTAPESRGAETALACPHCRGELAPRSDGLTCSSCGAAYPIEGGIQILLPEL